MAGPNFALLRAGNAALFKEMLQRWWVVGKTVSVLTHPRFEPQTFHSRDKRATACPTGWLTFAPIIFGTLWFNLIVIIFQTVIAQDSVNAIRSVHNMIYEPGPISTVICKFLSLVFQSIICCCSCCCSPYLSSCHWTTPDANLLDNPHTFHCIDYFVIGGIRTSSGVSKVPVDFFEFLSTEFAAWSKPPSRDNHCKVSFARTQKRKQGAG